MYRKLSTTFAERCTKKQFVLQKKSWLTSGRGPPDRAWSRQPPLGPTSQTQWNRQARENTANSNAMRGVPTAAALAEPLVSWLPNVSTNSTASVLHRPPVSMPTTTKRHVSPAKSSTSPLCPFWPPTLRHWRAARSRSGGAADCDVNGQLRAVVEGQARHQHPMVLSSFAETSFTLNRKNAPCLVTDASQCTLGALRAQQT